MKTRDNLRPGLLAGGPTSGPPDVEAFPVLRLVSLEVHDMNKVVTGTLEVCDDDQELIDCQMPPLHTRPICLWKSSDRKRSSGIAPLRCQFLVFASVVAATIPQLGASNAERTKEFFESCGTVHVQRR